MIPKNQIKAKLESLAFIAAIKSQADLYDELVILLDTILDGYFDNLDNHLVNRDCIQVRRLEADLFDMRESLAYIFDEAHRLQIKSHSHLKRLQTL